MHEIHYNLYDRAASATTGQLKPTLLRSAMLGRGKQAEKPFLEPHFCLDRLAGHLVSKNVLLQSHLIALAPKIPLAILPLRDIKAQKLPTLTSDPATILGALTGGTFDKDRLNGLEAKWLSAD